MHMDDRDTLSRRFIEMQTHLNNSAVKSKIDQSRQTNRVVQFNSKDRYVDPFINNTSIMSNNSKAYLKNQEYATLLKDQMTLNELEGNFNQTRSRITDKRNDQIYKITYPYGKENVQITEEIIDKYSSNNYLNQKNVLDKFKIQAEEYRRNLMNKNRHSKISLPKYVQCPLYPYEQRVTGIESEHLKSQRQLERTFYNYLEKEEEKKRKERQERERRDRRKRKKEFLAERERENLTNVANMLREIQVKINYNSTQVQSNLKMLRNQIVKEDNKIKSRLYMEKLLNREERLRQESKKVPIIIYNNQCYDARQYCSSERLPIPKVERSFVHQRSNEMNEVVSILQKNKKRVDLLSQTEDILSREQAKMYSYK